MTRFAGPQDREVRRLALATDGTDDVALGSATDTWGRAWSPATFADATFRVRVINVAGSTLRDFFPDWVAVPPPR